MATQIIYGIGKGIVEQDSGFMAYANMQDLQIQSSNSEDPITGGNKMFPIASFPKEKGIKVSATNADWNSDTLKLTEGATSTTGATTMRGFIECKIPEDGVITLDHAPVEDSVKVTGFTLSDTAAAGKSYSVAEDKVTFAAGDAGTLVSIIYEYESAATTTTYSVFENSMAKTFKFTYLFPIYDTDNNIVANGQIVVYKAKCTSGTTFDFKHRTAFSPKFEAEAQDPQRNDGKLWDFAVEPVAIAG